MRENNLKVWSLAGFWVGVEGSNGRNQVRLIVAAKTQKEAALLLKVSLHHFRGYASETGNKIERGVALNHAGKVFWRTLDAWDEPYTLAPGQAATR